MGLKLQRLLLLLGGESALPTNEQASNVAKTVSYTHLTLPTKA